ncbi:hypothetical protein BJY01DRAFT_72635 [Aspergillus pseudoustus]|uniref:Uncharacterized protein n=1 Tax=Aspergillus pseudoustus TaxID=1810923 RepID=A0ABR4L3J4_9EURO
MLMAGALIRRSSRPSTRAGWGLFHVLQSRIRCLSECSSPEAHRKTGPSQSDILTFALTRALRPRYGEDTDSNLRRLLRNSFVEEWRTRTTPVPSWDVAIAEGETFPTNFAFRLRCAQNIHDLGRIVEQDVNHINGRFLVTDEFNQFSQALRKVGRLSSLGEILTLINILEMRLKRLGIEEISQLHAFGMHYAALGFCEPSLEHHLHGYLSITRDKLSPSASRELVRSLRSSFTAVSFQHPEYNTSKMRHLISGSSDPDEPSLHGVLWWTGRDELPRGFGCYMALLVQIQEDAMHRRIWDKQLEKKSTWVSEGGDFTSVYEYALALVVAGDSSAALTVLTETSTCAEGSLPGLAEFHGLDKLLEHDAIRKELLSLVKDSDTPRILHRDLKRIEDRLGIKWQYSEERHIGASGPPWSVASEKPILTIDADSTGYDSSHRLVAEIEALGCSKSGADLERIAELLEEYEGNLVRVLIPSWDASDSEFYWAPQGSPMDVSKTRLSLNTNGNEVEPARALGLIRVAPEQTYFLLQHSLHLIQLGYLFKKQLSPANDVLDVSPDLERTGYLVTWDRLNGCFVAIFAGNSFGPIASTSEFQESVTFAGTDSIAQIYPLADEEPEEVVEYLHLPRYRIEVDINPNLVKDVSSGSLED